MSAVIGVNLCSASLKSAIMYCDIFGNRSFLHFLAKSVLKTTVFGAKVFTNPRKLCNIVTE